MQVFAMRSAGYTDRRVSQHKPTTSTCAQLRSAPPAWRSCSSPAQACRTSSSGRSGWAARRACCPRSMCRCICAEEGCPLKVPSVLQCEAPRSTMLATCCFLAIQRSAVAGSSMPSLVTSHCGHRQPCMISPVFSDGGLKALASARLQRFAAATGKARPFTRC